MFYSITIFDHGEQESSLNKFHSVFEWVKMVESFNNIEWSKLLDGNDNGETMGYFVNGFLSIGTEIAKRKEGD